MPGPSSPAASLVGRFLVAAPSMPDERFRKSVVFLCKHDDDGALGIIVNNSVDEAMAGRCTRIDVTVLADGSVTIEDDGHGIPTGMHEGEGKSGVEVVMTMLHAGGKFDKKAYQVSGGLHGVGGSVVNALSAWLEVEVRQNGKVYRQKYARGIPQTELDIIGETETTGTIIRFMPDADIFETIIFDSELISHRLRELAFLNKGLEIRATDERTGKADIYHFEGGVVQFVGGDPWYSYGLNLIIRHENGYESTYAHLRDFATDITQGSVVKQGDTIGYSGNTGRSTGPHLHFEIRVYGVPYDPIPLLDQ